MERLRGNTFLLLLLRAGCQVLLNPQEYGESKGGVTKPNMLADLIKLTNPQYEPTKLDTLGSYFSKYLAGSPPKSPTYLPFTNPSYRYGLETRLEEERPTVLKEADTFCRTYLEFNSLSNRQLVAGLIDVILADDSFDGEFDIGDKKVRKEDLSRLDKSTPILLQAFLCSVWANILKNHPDTSEGQETYLAWTEDAGYNTAREICTDVGFERTKKIAVSTDLPEEVLADTTEKKAKEHTEEIKKDPADEAEPNEDIPVVEVYEAPYTDPRTQQQVVAQFHVEAKDNGIAIGQVFGGLVIGKRGKDE